MNTPNMLDAKKRTSNKTEYIKLDDVKSDAYKGKKESK